MVNRNLKSKLRERYSRLQGLDGVSYSDECRYLLNFVHSDSYCNDLLTELEARASVDVLAWIKARDQDPHLAFPPTEGDRAKICYTLLKIGVGAPNPLNQYLQCGRWFGRRPTSDHVLRQYTEEIIKPLIDYMCDRIDDEHNLFHVIQRFKLKCEWFRREELYARYSDNPRTGETDLTNQLRASLFDAGIDFPFSEPESPSGKADTVASPGTPSPLVLEAKIYDPERGKHTNNLRQGFHQVLRYAEDYQSSVGYLVIFNCSDHDLVITPEAGTEPEYPVRLDHGGKTFFVIAINLNPSRPSASKEDTSSRRTVLYEQLVGREEDSE